MLCHVAVAAHTLQYVCFTLLTRFLLLSRATRALRFQRAINLYAACAMLRTHLARALHMLRVIRVLMQYLLPCRHDIYMPLLRHHAAQRVKRIDNYAMFRDTTVTLLLLFSPC